MFRLRACLNKVGCVAKLPSVMVVISRRRRCATLQRYVALKVPAVYLVSAGYSPSLTSVSVPTGSSTVTSVQLVLGGLMFTVYRNHSDCVQGS